MSGISTCTVLLADDDSSFCTSLRDVLEAGSHQVEVAHTGREALAACREQVFDLLLLDISLPDLSGLELISRVEEIRPQLDILVITGHASFDNAVGSVSRSTIGYLVKPIDLDRLLRILAGIARRKRIAEENRRLQDSIDLARRQWSSTFRAISDPIVIIGANGSVRRANRAFCERFGVSSDEVKGRSAVSLLFRSETSGTEPLDDSPSTLPETSTIRERNDLSVPGVFEVSCDPVDLEDERGTICVLRDVTARKRAEAEREELIRKLAATNAELEQYTYTVSHDLKSPLFTISGFLGTVAQGVEKGDTGQVKADIQRIETAAGHMGRLLDELLEISRIGRFKNQSEELSLSDVARSAAELVTSPQGEHSVSFQIAPSLPKVTGDRIRLTQLFQNLLENAVKFMGDQLEPRIEVSQRRQDSQSVVCVTDNGIGIDADDHGRIFDLFQQLDQGATGTGVGLVVVQKIVKLHGGRIWVESEGRGHGSRFCFTLPQPA